MRAAALRSAIEDLLSAFFWKIDRRETDDMANLFTEEGRLIIPDLANGMRTSITVAGREALSKQWANRPPDLVSRHVYTNLQIFEASEREAKGRCIGLGFRHTGPGLGLPAPVIVTDQDDLYERGTDGLWRFREKRITAIFIAPDLVGR